ncbi:MAG: D-aminoacyl-tRNA deacylase [Candidatus Limnocylindrales bacterium]|jgi:D-tyrosyl-tRNA(Tyr) deacylase
MRALLQRVSRAEVRIEGRSVASIGPGLLILLGVAPADDEWVAAGLAAKVAGLRIFADADGLTNLSAAEVGGAALVVSQFTLYADSRRGRRPSFMDAAGPVVGERLYEVFCEILATTGIPVAQGRFGADMAVELVNDGPFTIWLDSAELGLQPKPAS